jgi:hypothetical protein
MACCGRGKRKAPKPNGKLCPRCGWAMYRVHKYDTTTRSVTKYFQCSNKHALRTGACNYREKIE